MLHGEHSVLAWRVDIFCACTNPADSISPSLGKYTESTGVFVITNMPFGRLNRGRKADASMSVRDFMRIVGVLTRHHCVVFEVARVPAQSNFVCC